MARIRTVKPEFWTDEKVVMLSPMARLAFIGLWNFCDDEGRAVCSPARLKMQIFPADSVEFRPLLAELEGQGLIQIYVIDKTEYLQVCGFNKHQKIDKRAKSKLPSPPTSPDFPQIFASPIESPHIPPTEGKGKEWNGEDTPAIAGNPDEPASSKVPKRTSEGYAFESGVIRLNKKDLDSWTAAYSHLDLRAELLSLSEWAEKQGGKWFHAVAGALAKRNRDVGIKIKQGAGPPKSDFYNPLAGIQ